jgi:hypothetical protein
MKDEQGRASPIKDIVNKVIADLSGGAGARPRMSAEEIGGLWKRAAGAFASRQSRPASLRKGKLVVAVGNSSLLYNLTLKKRGILAELTGGSDGRIQEIQFRIGETGGENKIKNQKSKRKNRG